MSGCRVLLPCPVDIFFEDHQLGLDPWVPFHVIVPRGT